MFRKMYPGQDFREKKRILIIAVVFIGSLATRSVYEWYMYYMKKTYPTQKQYLQKLLMVNCVFMPIIWDVFPIVMIYWLHLVNFSSSVTLENWSDEDEQESTRCMTGFET